MTQKKSSKEEVTERGPEARLQPGNPDANLSTQDMEVVIEGEETPEIKIEEAPKQDSPDVEALRKQVSELQSAQEASRLQAREYERAVQQAAMELMAQRQMAEQSQLDSIDAAMGAAQIEVDSAKQDIVRAGVAQDYVLLADSQERLAAAKANLVALEQGKHSFAARRTAQQQNPTESVMQSIEQNQNLNYDEKQWLRQHPDAMGDPRKQTKLHAAYYDAMDKGLNRGSKEYFEFLEERLGYRQPAQQQKEPEESSVVVAAPVSRSNTEGTGTGGAKTTHRITAEEVEIAKLSGITPADYVREKLKLQELKKQGHYNER